MICPNCNSENNETDKYCSTCGQKNSTLKHSLSFYISEILGSMFNLDSAFFRTFKYLIFYPGKLSRRYLEGERIKFLSPVRIYLISSVLYFFVFGISANNAGELVDRSFQKIDTTGISVNLGVNDIPINVDSVAYYLSMNRAQLDSFLVARGTPPNWFSRLYAKQIFRFANQGAGGFFKQVQKNYSISLFLLMPLFALLLLLIYRKKELYIGHLVFSIHFHSLIFLLLFITGVLSFFISPLVYLALLALAFVLMFIWLKNFYGYKGVRGFLRFLVTISLYGFVLFAAFASIMMISLALF